MALAKTLWNKLNRNVALAHSKKDDNNSNGFSQNKMKQKYLKIKMQTCLPKGSIIETCKQRVTCLSSGTTSLP